MNLEEKQLKLKELSQLLDSCLKEIETLDDFLTEDEFKDYCDALATLVAYQEQINLIKLNMKNLLELLKAGDDTIKNIKNQQTQLITNYVKDNFNYEIGTVFYISQVKCVITNFKYSKTNGIEIQYKRFKANGTLGNMEYITKLRKFDTEETQPLK